MSVITALLALSLLGAPEKSCTAAAQTGTFRITAVTPNGANAMVGMVVLENINGCLEATLITDSSAPTIIDGLSLKGNTLTGSMQLGSGVAKVTLQLSAASVDGSIVEREHVWAIKGLRTNGDATHVASTSAVSPR